MNRRVLLAVTGGIAAYKAPELVRQIQSLGHEVRCVLTASAREFVSPLVLQTISGNAVRSQLFDPAEEGSIDHIALADWAEIVVVAPATANVLAKMASGIADDLVTTLLLATQAPVLVAPAMNVNMWQHEATQNNVEVARSRGVHFVGPDAGWLACGWQGEGRMSDPEVIAQEVNRILGPASLQGEVVLVTAGGTREPIDCVRFVTNRSSGKMGYAIAEEAARRGAEVVLISAPTSLRCPQGVIRIDVETAEEMRQAVLHEFDRSTIVIKAAAVSDFRPEQSSDQKIKKENLEEVALQLRMVQNQDILAEICQKKESRLIVGFAAESEDVVEAARRKIQRKGCDLIVANDISGTESGFDVDVNTVVLVSPDGEAHALPRMTKREVAVQLMDHLEKMREERQR